MNNNKKLAIAGVSALGIAAVGFGAFAFFSDSSEQNTEGTVGTVDVESVTNLDLSGKENINPGDEDPENPYDPEDPGKTTPHKLSFSISNAGTKSIRTRNIIDITITSTEGANLDPSAFALYEKGADNVNVDLGDLTDLEVSKEIITVDGKQVLRYIIMGASLNGEAGKLEDKDILAGDVVRPSVSVNESVSSVDYAYYLGMSPDALDVYQGAKVKIDLTVQAMQYRNTNNSNWADVFKDSVETGN